MGTSEGVVSYMLWPVFKAGLHLRPCSTVCCCKFYKGIKPPDSSYLLKIRRWRHHDYHCSLLWINVSPTAFFAVSWVWCFFMDPSLQLSTAPRSFRFFLTFSRLTLGHAKETLAQETPHGLQHPYSGAFCVWVSVQSSNPAMTESKDLTRIKFIKKVSWGHGGTAQRARCSLLDILLIKNPSTDTCPSSGPEAPDAAAYKWNTPR